MKNAVLDATDDEYLTACLDIGHAEMMGDMTNAVEMIKALGKRLQALHIHDNDGWKDLHQIPFSMKIDFYAIAKALKAIDYKGYFTLECPTYMNAFTSENSFAGVKNLAASVKKFNAIYESL